MKRYLKFAILFDIIMSFVLGLVFFGYKDSLFFLKGFLLVCICDIVLTVALRIYMYFKVKDLKETTDENAEDDESDEIRIV